MATVLTSNPGTAGEPATATQQSLTSGTALIAARKKAVTFVLGQMAEYAGSIVEIIGRTDNYRLFVRDRNTGDTEIVNALHLKSVDDGLSAQDHEAVRQQGNAALSRQRASVIEGLLAIESPTAVDHSNAAQALSLSTRQLGRIMDKYKLLGTVDALMPARAGRKTGKTMLSDEMEALIEEIISSQLRASADISVSDIHPLIERQCARVLNAKAPSPSTIERRLNILRQRSDLVPTELARKQREKARPIKEHYEVSESLAVVQIDHTPFDVMVVDSRDRLPIGRPTLTVAIDVSTRCVIGLHLGFEAPGCLVVALCLLHAAYPKDEWLRSLDIAHSWPMHGLMKILHCDNGAEFRSVALADGCRRHTVDLQFRPPATPRFGGHIERYLGTLAKKLHALPGKTFSEALGGRPEGVDRDAALTLDELTSVVARLIIRYHETKHRIIGCSPRAAWERAWSTPGAQRAPRVPINKRQFFLDLLPRVQRVVTREGIRLFGLEFASESLRELITPCTKQIIRFDPRDLSRIYLQQQNAPSIDVPLRDQRMPRFSLLEWREIQKRDRSVGQIRNPDIIAALLDENKQIIDNAKTLRNRRRRARQASWSHQFTPTTTLIVDTPESLAGPSDAEYDVNSLPSFNVALMEDL